MPLSEIESQMLKIVVARFMNLKEATHRKDLVTKFKNIEAVNRLLMVNAVKPVDNDGRITPLAFGVHLAGDPDSVKRAKISLEIVLDSLQRLYEVTPPRKQIKRSDVLAEAARVHGDVSPEIIERGLYFAQEFPVFDAYGPEPGVVYSQIVPKLEWMVISERIVTVETKTAWDEHVRGRTASMEVILGSTANATAGHAKSAGRFEDLLYSSADMRELSPEEEQALADFKRQRAQLEEIEGKNAQHPAFVKWRDVTREVFKRYLPKSAYHTRFINIAFTLHSYTGDPQDAYLAGVNSARGCLDAAIEHIERFGLDTPLVAKAYAPVKEMGGMHFHGQVTIQNLAVAMDNAVQEVNQTASNEGEALKSVGDILRESGELRQREVAQALEVIAQLATEMRKPKEQWSWKSIFGWTTTILEISDKATDMATKLSPHLPVLVGLLEAAKHMLGW